MGDSGGGGAGDYVTSGEQFLQVRSPYHVQPPRLCAAPSALQPKPPPSTSLRPLRQLALHAAAANYGTWRECVPGGGRGNVDRLSRSARKGRAGAGSGRRPR